MDAKYLLHWITAIRLIAIFALGFGFSAPIAHADLIYFRKGGDAQIPATTEGNRVVIEMPDGRITLPGELIRKRVPGFWPVSEWQSRLEAVQGAASAADRYAGIWWAIENGLTMEVTDEIRAVHALDPGHAATARLAAALERLAQPCPDPDFSRFRKAVAVETQVATGRHVILLHQHSEAEAAERLAVLERVIRGYTLLFAAQGIELPGPRQKLVSVWFADENDYHAFLHSEKAEAFGTTRGYYHPTWNAVVAFDARSTDQQKKPRAALGFKRDELKRYGEVVENAPPRARVKVKLGDEPIRTVSLTEAKAMIERVRGDVDCENLLLDLDRRSVDLGTAAHEMVHQLMSNTGLCPRHDAFPLWLHEGLAAQFEVIRGGRWAGISRAHDLRLPDWRRLSPPPRLERVVRDAGFGHGYNRDIYAQAWALVYYLRTQHSKQFLTFLDLLRNPNRNEPSPILPSNPGDRVFTSFQHAFGSDINSLEHDWYQFLQTVQTPLEQHAPPADPTLKTKRPAAKAKN